MPWERNARGSLWGYAISRGNRPGLCILLLAGGNFQAGVLVFDIVEIVVPLADVGAGSCGTVVTK